MSMSDGASGFKTVGEERPHSTTGRPTVPPVGGLRDREGAAGRTVVPSRGGNMSVSLGESHLRAAGVPLAARRPSQPTIMNTIRPHEKNRMPCENPLSRRRYLESRRLSRFYKERRIEGVLINVSRILSLDVKFVQCARVCALHKQGTYTGGDWGA